jgi:hypothetical protein
MFFILFVPPFFCTIIISQYGVIVKHLKGVFYDYFIILGKNILKKVAHFA